MSNTLAKLLIVDDDAINIRMLDNLLCDDYEIVIALNGADAIKRALTTRPDLILLDIQMPEMDGYEVCRRLKDSLLTREIPIIFVTVMNHEEDEEKGLALGAVDYITKPYRAAIIKARLRNHLTLSNQRNALNRLTSLDALTGIASRQSAEVFLDHQWLTAIHLHEPLSIIFMDIDYFEQYNEHYGRAAGDVCLIEVATLLKSSLTRPTDFLARYDGEELICILPKTDLQTAVFIAERLRALILSRAIPHDFSEIHHCVTLSFGVAALNPVQAHDLASTLISTAHALLCHAKIQGRNQVMS
jgi:diguanylate cyclase (GGDEF)-like protein